MCNIWRKIYVPELTIEEIGDFFEKNNRFSWIGITGGEPFLRTDLSQIIDIILNKCNRLCALHFATNGTLTDKIVNLIERINDKNKKIRLLFTISIDGPASLHDDIRGVKGTWEKAMETFLWIKNSYLAEARIGFTLLHFNVGRFKDTFFSIKEVYPDLKFDDITINIFQKSDFYYENQDMEDLNPEEVIVQIKEILMMDNNGFSINNFLRRMYLRLYPEYLETKKSPLKCQALSSTCFLDPYGNLYPCAVYNKSLMNIKLSSPLKLIWNSKRTRLLSNECANNLCPGCWSPCDAYSAILGSLFLLFYKKKYKIYENK